MRHLPFALVLLILVAGCRQDSSAAVEEPGPSQDRGNWRKLKKGMTQEQVKALLGEPVQVEKVDDATCWHYRPGQPLERHATDPNEWRISRGSLLFSAKGTGDPKLTEWREP